MTAPTARSSTASAALSWLPLAAGALNSYGPIAFNYGFALYFLTYRHGFVKRALVGEMFSPFAFISRSELLAIEYAFLAIAFAFTYIVFRPLLFGTVSERRLAAALLSAPALLPHIGWLFAQPDVTLYILLLASVAALLHLPPKPAAALTCVLCCIALLGHEAFSLMFYPLVAAILLHLVLKRRLPWQAAVANLVVFSAAFLAILHWGALKASPDVVLQEAQARTNVGVQRQVYDVMASTFAEQEALVRKMYSPHVIRILVLTVVLSLPYFVLLGRLLNRAILDAGGPPLQRRFTPLMFASSLLLCGLGHDTTRWMGAMCIQATFFILYLYLSEPRDSAVRSSLSTWADSPSFIPWLAYLLLIGPFGATGLRSADQLVSAWFGS